MAIHPTAIVDRHAELDPTVEVGPYAIIEAGAQIQADTRIWHHAHVGCGARIGRRCQIHPFAVVSHPPQDLKWSGTPSYVQVGDDTILREHVSIHRGTMPESTTTIGARCFLMGASHVAHNCCVGDEVKMAQGAMLGGHATVGHGTFVGGNAAVHQFVRVGEMAMVAGVIRLIQDVPPFMLVGSQGPAGVNVIGLRRAGYPQETRTELRACYRLLYRSGLLFSTAVERIAQTVRTDSGRRLLAFLQAPSKRGYARYTGSREGPDEAAE